MIGFREVEAFRAVVATGSLSQAARQLNTSQPNVTRLIGRLEKAVGFRLFIRQSRGVIPTAEGEMLYTEVAASFHGLLEIARSAREIREFQGAQLTLGAMSSMIPEIVTEAALRWRGLHGELALAIEIHDAQRIVQWVRARRFDLGFVSPVLDLTDTTIIVRRQLEYVLLSAPGCPLGSGTERVDLAGIEGRTLILPGAGYILSRIPDRKAAQRVQELGRIDAYYSVAGAHMAQSGLGTAIVDPITARFFQRSFGAVVERIQTPPSFDLALIAPTKPTHARAAVRFGEFLTDALNSFET